MRGAISQTRRCSSGVTKPFGRRHGSVAEQAGMSEYGSGGLVLSAIEGASAGEVHASGCAKDGADLSALEWMTLFLDVTRSRISRLNLELNAQSTFYRQDRVMPSREMASTSSLTENRSNQSSHVCAGVDLGVMACRNAAWRSGASRAQT